MSKTYDELLLNALQDEAKLQAEAREKGPVKPGGERGFDGLFAARLAMAARLRARGVALANILVMARITQDELLFFFEKPDFLRDEERERLLTLQQEQPEIAAILEEMRQAYRDPELREELRARNRAWFDWNHLLFHAKLDVSLEIAGRLSDRGLDRQLVMDLTGLEQRNLPERCRYSGPIYPEDWQPAAQ